jgi:GntR family transcriptional regulator / MocR family aminotransferase
VLFPSLRLAYLVVPPDLVGAFTTARTLLDGHTALLPQAVLADFMRQGHFAAHLRRMRALYHERRDVLRDAVARERPPGLRLGPAEGGLHVTAHLAPGVRDLDVVARAARRGLDLSPLSSFYLGPARPGLVLGFAALPPAAIREGVRELARVLRRPGA